MLPPLRRTAHVILMLAVLASATFGPTAAATEALSPVSTPVATVTTPTSAAGEVRLRKLHLVRPDLIRYPMALDVYC